MEVRDLGRMEYGECLALQHELRDALRMGRGEDTILVVEHPSVATLGRRGTADEVFDRDLPVFQIERGGKATLHGPGQLVVYPIMHMGEGNRDVRAWVRHLEAFIHKMLRHFGIETHTKVDLPGVWTVDSDKKIASIGIAIQHWISFHGIAVNITLEPDEFQRIDPCGLGAAVMTNMQREGTDVDLEEVKAWALAHAADHFGEFFATNNPAGIAQDHYY